MTPEDRIATLERELAETREAAVEMVSTIVRGLVKRAERRDEIARALESAVKPSAGPAVADLVREVASAVRRPD